MSGKLRQGLPRPFILPQFSGYEREKGQTGMPGKGQARLGPFRNEFERNRKKILMSQDTCGICGKPVDKRLKYPDPMSPTIDHIIPIARGGHPADLENLQLAHRCCNRAKSDKLQGVAPQPEEIGNRNLPWSRDWKAYRGGQAES